MNSFSSSLVTVVGMFVGLAIVAVVLSKNAQTGTVLSNFGTAMSNIIGAAVKPVTG